MYIINYFTNYLSWASKDTQDFKIVIYDMNLTPHFNIPFMFYVENEMLHLKGLSSKQTIQFQIKFQMFEMDWCYFV